MNASLRSISPPEDATPQPRRPGLSLAVLGAAVVVLLATGLWFYLAQAAEVHRSAAETLQAIAELKARQIADWRRERLGDASLIHTTPYVTRRALDTMAHPESAATRRMFTSWLDSLLAGRPYRRAMLLDAELKIHLNYPDQAPEELCPALREPARQALRTREVVMADLHEAAATRRHHLSVILPLVVRREGGADKVPAVGVAASPDDHSAGALVLETEAEDFLFPLIQSWPTASASAETLLVKRDGDSVVFLNELRHRTNTALRLRSPLSANNVPAVMAVLGRREVVRGEDYRGVEVFAALEAVPDSPWFLVAKLDADEVLAPWRVRSRLLLALLLVSLGALGAVGAGIWLGRDRAYYRALYRAQSGARRAEAALLESEERYRLILENSLDAILLGIPDGAILQANRAACEMFGRTEEELKQIGRAGVLCDDDPQVRAALTERQRTGRFAGEITMKRRDGSPFPAEVSSAIFTDQEGRLRTSIVIRDITRRKQLDEALHASLEEQTALLKEVHHRVKNNLQIVVSLLNLQAAQVTNKFAMDILRDTQGRIRSLALLHETLYRQGTTARANAAVYFANICDHLGQSFGASARRIQIERRIAAVDLDLDRAIPCGLMVNELVTNAFKHAFPHGGPGRILVELRAETGPALTLTVADDGVGLPPGLDLEQTNSLGLRLITGLAGQIDGTIETANGAGATFRILFPHSHESKKQTA